MNDIVRFDVVKVRHDTKKLCKCYEPTYELDIHNRLVYCTECGAIVDPFTALREIARTGERMDRYMDTLREEVISLQSYKPRLRVIRRLEEKYYGNMPICPICNQAFDFKDIVRWQNKRIYKQVSTKEELKGESE